MIRRIAFLGTPEISTYTLRFLADEGYQIPIVVTGEDKRRGRGATLSPSPVKALANELGLRVSHDPKELLEVDFDLAVVVAYGKLISEELLNKGLFVNLHFSLLPRWRGAAPMERAILEGDDETGICVMKLVKELDAGPIYQMRRMKLEEDVTLSDLALQLSRMANEALGAELSRGEQAFKEAIEQVGDAVYARKLSVDELRIDWTASSEEILRKVRLERAWTTLDGVRFKIIGASEAKFEGGALEPGKLSGVMVGTGSGVIALEVVQPANKRAMSASEWTNGMQNAEDLRFA